MNFTLDWMLATAGGLTGMLVGLTGVGGGSVMTPLLLLVFGVAPLSAVGTDLWFAAITKLVATRVHHGSGLIDWQVVRRLWLGSLPASALALVWVTHSPLGADSSAWLRRHRDCDRHHGGGHAFSEAPARPWPQIARGQGIL